VADLVGCLLRVSSKVDTCDPRCGKMNNIITVDPEPRAGARFHRRRIYVEQTNLGSGNMGSLERGVKSWGHTSMVMRLFILVAPLGVAVFSVLGVGRVGYTGYQVRSDCLFPLVSKTQGNCSVIVIGPVGTFQNLDWLLGRLT